MVTQPLIDVFRWVQSRSRGQTEDIPLKENLQTCKTWPAHSWFLGRSQGSFLGPPQLHGEPSLSKFEVLPKKCNFRFLPKNLQAMDEVEHFFANFQILGPLGSQGWVVIPLNVKKPKSLHPTVEAHQFNFRNPVLLIFNIFLACFIYGILNIYTKIWVSKSKTVVTRVHCLQNLERKFLLQK
jgi:hypothetical protein